MAKLRRKTIEQDNGEYCIKLSSALQLSDISSFYNEIKSNVQNDNHMLCFDASEISRMSSAHVQVFISLFRWLQSRDVTYKIVKPSQEFLQIFVDLGISQEEINNLVNSRIDNE